RVPVRTRKGSACDFVRSRGRDCRALWLGRRVLSRQSDGTASARNEHAVRRSERKRRAYAGAEQRSRIDGYGWTDRRGGAETADPDWKQGNTRVSGMSLSGERTIGERHTTYSGVRSEEHTSELQSRENLVCRLLLEKKKKSNKTCQTT